MGHYKNRKPKKYKGCCWMCACKDRRGGCRNKRKRTIQEHREAITAREAGLNVKKEDHRS